MAVSSAEHDYTVVTLVPPFQSASSSSVYSSPEKESKRQITDSTSGLLNILSTMKKAAMQKASAESRRRYSQAVTEEGTQQGRRQARSEVDLSQIPGSCSYLRRQFDAAGEEEQVRGGPSGFSILYAAHYEFWVGGISHRTEGASVCTKLGPKALCSLYYCSSTIFNLVTQ